MEFHKPFNWVRVAHYSEFTEVKKSKHELTQSNNDMWSNVVKQNANSADSSARVSSFFSICKFSGTSCWNEKENRIILLEPVEMNHLGQVPEPLQFCQSLQALISQVTIFSELF